MSSQLELLYHSQDLWVYNKPPNLSLLSDRSGAPDLWSHLKASGEKPYLVHRLDKGTSGVLLIARNQATQSQLTRLFEQRNVDKYYVADVVGELHAPSSLMIDLPLCKGRKSRYRVAGLRENILREGHRYSVTPDRDGHAAASRVRTLSVYRRAHAHGEHKDAQISRILVKPLTGRTHQIRVHLSWIGHALVGDRLYGEPDHPQQQAPRLMLHCHRLTVPGFGTFVAPLPVMTDTSEG